MCVRVCLAAGWLLDYWGSTLANGLLMQFAASAIGLVFAILGMMTAQTLTAFIGLGSVFLFACFMVQAPSYAISMWTIPVAYRPASQVRSKAAAAWQRLPQWMRRRPRARELW